jgi:hypothetical protein
MALNLGYIEGTAEDGDVRVRIYYDGTQPVSPDQPLINGPRGWCLDVTNLSGRRAQVTLSGVTGNPLTFSVGQGDPVTSGQSRSRTAAQVAALGFTTRGSVGNFALDSS